MSFKPDIFVLLHTSVKEWRNIEQVGQLPDRAITPSRYAGGIQRGARSGGTHAWGTTVMDTRRHVASVDPCSDARMPCTVRPPLTGVRDGVTAPGEATRASLPLSRVCAC